MGPWHVGLIVLLVGIGACGGAGDVTVLEAESMLSVSIPGTAGGRTTTDTDPPRVTRLFDVTGDWNAVSVAIADAAQAAGWTIESVNCVGTGNDVIARKNVDGTWLLLESGAGTRGAGIIVSIASAQRPPKAFQATGSCPRALESAAQES